MDLMVELGKLKSNGQRGYILLLVAGLDEKNAKEYVPETSYFRWLHDETFKSVLANVPELFKNYSEQARDMIHFRSVAATQGMEDDIVALLKEEIKTKNYKLLLTNLGKEILLRHRTPAKAPKTPPPTKIYGSWAERAMGDFGIDVGKKEKSKKGKAWSNPVIPEPEEEPVETDE